MGGSGVQRPAKFARYLKEIGWEPIVVAPEPGLYHTFDPSLVAELEEASIRIERVQNRSLFSSRKKGKAVMSTGRWKSAVLKWITSWFFLPDNKKGWIKEAVLKCEEIINSEPIEAIFATAPPYSNLIAAAELKKRTGIPVVMDLRDDWLESHLIRYPTGWHYRKMREIEKSTLSAASHITVVNDYYARKIGRRLGELAPAITTIPNGYDKNNFKGVFPAGDSEKFSILYSGLFYGSRRPDWLLEAVRIVMGRNSEFEERIDIQFQGGLGREHWKTINRMGLTTKVTDFGYVKHQYAVQNLVNADLLFLTLGERDHIEAVTPGKVFEYMGSLNPILAFIPEGATRELLKKYGAAKCTDIRDTDTGADYLESFFELWQKDLLPKGDEIFVQQFERFNTALILSEVLENVADDGE